MNDEELIAALRREAELFVDDPRPIATMHLAAARLQSLTGKSRVGVKDEMRRAAKEALQTVNRRKMTCAELANVALEAALPSGGVRVKAEEIQLLMRLRDNQQSGVHDVIEGDHERWEIGRALSDRGLIAIVAHSKGGIFHITRLGLKVLGAAIEPTQAQGEGAGCACQSCGKTYVTDMLVPDDVWENLTASLDDVANWLFTSRIVGHEIRALNAASTVRTATEALTALRAERERLEREVESSRLHFTMQQDDLRHFMSAAEAAEARATELRGLLDIALGALDNYADPSGYFDNLGEDSYTDSDEHHPGTLAKETAQSIRAALHPEREG